jgi:hypothetical protein
MTYDEWSAQQQPAPPGTTDLLRSYSDSIRNFPTNRYQQTDLLRSYSDAIRRPTPAPATPGVDLNPAINADLARFGRSVMEAPGRIRDWLNAPSGNYTIPLPGYRNDPNYQSAPQGNYTLRDDLRSLGMTTYPPGLRDMPRNTGAPFFPERNTEVIPGPVRPEATPYPRPPFLNFRNWMDTGEQGPLPLPSYRAGRYPDPYYTPMPGVYDARTSGGAVAAADNYGPGWSFQRALHSAGQAIPPALKAFANDVRSGILSDESIAAIKKDPMSMDALGSYLGVGIALSRGAGGKGPGELPRGAVPENIWHSWKIPNPDAPTIRVDNAGNHFEMVGTHKVGEPGEPGHTWHAIVKPVENANPFGISDKEMNQLKKEYENEPITPNEGVWHDNPFQKFLDKTYPKGTSGMFEDPPPLPPGELSKGTSKPGELYPGAGEDLNQIGKNLDDLDLPKKPLPPVSEKVAAEWWSALQEGDITKQQWYDAMDAIREGKLPPLPMPPDKPPGYWGNVNDRKYSSPLAGQTWADIYATPDVEFTVGPKDIEMPPVTNFPKEWDSMSLEARRLWLDRMQYKPPGL